jgi:hypothetical protein
VNQASASPDGLIPSEREVPSGATMDGRGPAAASR